MGGALRVCKTCVSRGWPQGRPIEKFFSLLHHHVSHLWTGKRQSRYANVCWLVRDMLAFQCISEKCEELPLHYQHSLVVDVKFTLKETLCMFLCFFFPEATLQKQWQSQEYHDVVGEIDLKPPHQRSSALNDLLLMLSSQDPIKETGPDIGDAQGWCRLQRFSGRPNFDLLLNRMFNELWEF